MPKSRGRKPRNHRNQSSRRGPTRRAPHRAQQVEGLDQMLSIMRGADEAEARGDAAGALAQMAEQPEGPDGHVFWRPERVLRLGQLYVFGQVLPRWATSRWVLAQALQAMDSTTRRISLEARDAAAQVRGDRPMAGVDPVDAHAKVLDHDWVYRQAFLYELGGLDHFLRRVATADLVAGADRIEEWAAAPMGAYRLVHESSRLLDWQDLRSDERLTTINIGAATLLDPGDCALGRVVPTDEGPMFEGPPLRVPDSAADAVADDPHDWLEAVTVACRETPMDDPDGCHPECFTFAMLTDVFDGVRHALQHVMVDRLGVGTSVQACDPVGLAAGLVRAAADGLMGDGGPGVSPWPSVAAALLDPHVTDRLVGDPALAVDQWWHLAEMLPRPASDVCALIADGQSEAA